MWVRLSLVLLVLSGTGTAQTVDPALNAKVLDELRAIRASMEKAERTHAALVALARIQIDEGRVAALEAQRLQLMAQEHDLEREAGPASSDGPSGAKVMLRVMPDGQPEVVSSGSAGASQATPAGRRLSETQRRRLEIEQSIEGLRKRIAVWEKQLEEALR
jgi:hypothetical protein